MHPLISRGTLVLCCCLSTVSRVVSQSEWVDPATPANARSVLGYMGGRNLSLVFSDEFQDEGRSFSDGRDTRWTSEDRPATTNAALHYYNSSHVTTKDGKLVIETTRQDANWVEYNPDDGQPLYFNRHYQSGMLTSWNKFCFTSGMIEISFQLPGDAMQPGLWPAFWMLGNLARPSYTASTDGIWPWSYDECGTSQEAINTRSVQQINSCQYGKGRGSPEIDIIEAQPGDFILYYDRVKFNDNTTKKVAIERPMISSSLQVAPGVASNLRPITPALPSAGQWYPDLYPMGGPAYGVGAEDGVIITNTERSANLSKGASNKTSGNASHASTNTSTASANTSHASTNASHATANSSNASANTSQKATDAPQKATEAPQEPADISQNYASGEALPRMLNNYWYGQTINESPEVWQDGLSVNWHHSPNFYKQQTVIRTEWQTGKDDGYVRWYSDDKLIFEITADTLKGKPGAADAIAQIPYEAMYLIMNTDVSPRWGWNGCNPTDACMIDNPGLCSSKGELLCLDCGNPDCLRCPEQTSWLLDFCNEIQPESPAQYKIDYIRVYQDTTDPTHSLGCNPPDYPTKQFIETNWERYTFNPTVNTAPLQVVQHGGGQCQADADCGNILAATSSESELYADWKEYIASIGPTRNSTCHKGKCQCPTDWTGPHCQSPCVGEYAECDQVYDDSSARSMSFHPIFISSMMVVAAALLLF